MFNRGVRADNFTGPYYNAINRPIPTGYVLLHNLLNPCRVAVQLIRLGHEPLPAKPHRSFFNLIGFSHFVPLYYPNAFSYSFHLLKTYGYWQILTRGFFSSFCLDITRETVSFMDHRYIVQRLLDSGEWLEDNEIVSDNQPSLLMRLIAKSSASEFAHLVRYFFLSKAYEVLITQPFFVIMMRQIASLISGEEGYSWFFQAAVSIYRDNGFLGFFSGLVPRMLYELSKLSIYLVLYRLANGSILGFSWSTSRNLGLYGFLADVTAHYSSYPLQVVGSVMALHGSRLSAPEVAEANSFSSWRECLHFLISREVHHRGYLPFWRKAPHLASTSSTPSSS
ncbi:hypothetical protein Aperf_G00000022304 [Anoplocephala perfoliata]